MRRVTSSTAAALRWALLGGAVAGTLDILFAIAFWWLRGIPPERIAQSVAAGVQGRAAFSGGAWSAALGLGLHYVIAVAMAVAYAWAARDVSALRERPWRYGALYGVALFVFMSFVVVPLSASPRTGALPVSWLICSVMAHIVLVGWPCAWSARRGWEGRWTARRESSLSINASA